MVSIFTSVELLDLEEEANEYTPPDDRKSLVCNRYGGVVIVTSYSVG